MRTASAPAVRLASRAAGAPRRTTRSKPRLGTGLVLGSYVVLSLLLFDPLLQHLSTKLLGTQDGVLFAWWVKEVPTALFHGHDPLLPGLLLHPHPVNAMWNTSVVLPAILMTPVTMTAGPIATVNLLLVASPAISAAAAYWMCRRFEASRPIAGLGGLLYGFGPYVVDESLGHPHVSLAWFPPVAIVVLRRILVTQEGSAVRAGIILGVLATAQLLCGEEILASSAIMASVGVILLVLSHPHSVRERGRHAVVALATAAGIGGALMAGPLAVQLLGPNRPQGRLLQTGRYVTDLVTFIAPTKMTLFDPLELGHLATHVTGNLAEDGGYLGPPLLLLSAFVCWRGRRDSIVRWSVSMAAVAALLSLGSRLHIDGHVTGIPLPWALLSRIPVLQDMLPSRLSVYVLLFLSLLVARGLTGLALTLVTRFAVAAAVAASAVFLWPHRPISTAQQPPQPAFFTGDLVRTLPRSSLVVISPTPDSLDPYGMLWQVDAGMRFEILNGYAAPWADDYPQDPTTLALDAIQQGRPLPSGVTTSSIRQDLQELGASAVVLGPGTAHLGVAEELFTAVIGLPPVTTGGVTVWILGPRWQ